MDGGGGDIDNGVFIGGGYVKRTHYEQVKEFHEAFGVTNKAHAGFPDLRTRKLRIELIDEEVDELKEAEENHDIVEIADALCDISYVVNGMALQYGIDLDACFAEVHASNMSKLGEDGKPIYRDDGKVLKGPNFFRPNLAKFLA